MKRVVTKRLVRFVLLNYLRYFGNSDPHLLQMTKQRGGLGRSRLPCAPGAQRGALSIKLRI